MAFGGGQMNDGNISHLRDIMTTYNKMTQDCFKSCISNMNYAKITELEESCINNCSAKYINGNNRTMQTFMEIQTRKQKAMIEEAEQKERERLAGNSVDRTPGQPGTAVAANILFNTPESGAAGPAPEIANTQPSAEGGS